MQNKSTWLLVGLVLVGVGVFSGCKRYSAREGIQSGDIFCDGKSVELVIAKEDEIWCYDPRPHGGSSYVVSKTDDMWLIHWSLLDGDEASQPVIQYSGQYELEKDRTNGKIIKRTGSSLWGMHCIGHPEVVADRAKNFKVLEKGVEKLPEQEISADPDVVGPQIYIFTRNRQHVFAWYPKPAIYSLPDMKLVKELATLYPDQIVLSVDVWQGFVMTDGFVCWGCRRRS